jgi:hypothetical protein
MKNVIVTIKPMLVGLSEGCFYRGSMVININIAVNSDKKLLNKISSPGFKLGKMEIEEKLKNAI